MRKNKNIENNSRLAVRVGGLLTLSVGLTTSTLAYTQEKPKVPISTYISAGSTTTSGGGVTPNVWFFINNNQSMSKTTGESSKNLNMRFLGDYVYKRPYILDAFGNKDVQKAIKKISKIEKELEKETDTSKQDKLKKKLATQRKTLKKYQLPLPGEGLSGYQVDIDPIYEELLKKNFGSVFSNYLSKGMGYFKKPKNITEVEDVNICYDSDAGIKAKGKQNIDDLGEYLNDYTLNCFTWQTYYRNMGLSVQSILSTLLVEQEEIFKDSRVGFASAFDHNLPPGEGGVKDQVAPVLPLGRGHLDNRKKTLSWLYGLSGQSDSLNYMKQVGETVKKITQHAKQEDKNNPFIKDPTKAFNNTSKKDSDNYNPILACRRNHLIIFTDGKRNSSLPGGFVDGVVNKKQNLPDTIEYDPILPYKFTGRADGNKHPPTFADITFSAWKTDLSGKWKEEVKKQKGKPFDRGKVNKNHRIPPYYPKVNGVVQEHNGDKYWHPYNDPAEWPHINTHIIGFGLKTEDDKKISRINPPFKNADEQRMMDNTTANCTLDYPTILEYQTAKLGVERCNKIGCNDYDEDEFKKSYENIKKKLKDKGITDLDQVNTATNNCGILSDILKPKSKPEWVWDFDAKSLSENEIHYDLAHAASAGRGRFYNATNAKELEEAIIDIFDMIKESSEATFGKTGSSGALANIQSGGSSFYSTRYDNKTFTGELVRRNLYDGTKKSKEECFEDQNKEYAYGTICKKSVAWSAAKEITKQFGENQSGRNVYTIKRDKNGKLVGGADFKFENLSKKQKERIKGNFFPGTFNHFDKPTKVSDDVKFKALIAYLKGDKTHETGDKTVKKFRTRKSTFEDGTESRNILGAIMRSSPIVSGVPRISQMHPDRYSDSYNDFVKRYLYRIDKDGNYKSSYPKKDPIKPEDVDIVYVGANDGMLHAIRATDGKEVFAYIPDAVYENLTKLTVDGEQVSYVDGNINVAVVGDKKSGWKKILIGGMGGGAKGIYALDVTNPTAKTAKDIVMWEYTDKESDNVGNILARPAVVQLNDGTWAVVFGNGYNAKSNKAALIVVNALTGKKIQEIILDNDYTDNDKTNGLAAPYFQILPNKQQTTNKHPNGVDRVYAGDLQGNMWVFDFSQSKNTSSSIKVVKEKIPLFVAKNKAGIRQPITVAPLVRLHPTKLGNIVHFGTGALFEENDLSSTIQNSIYAIWDDWLHIRHEGEKKGAREGNVVERAHLREVLFEGTENTKGINGKDITTKSGISAKIRTLAKGQKPIEWATDPSQVTFTKKKRGWFIDLPMGERAWQSPYYTFGSNNNVGIGYDTANYTPDSGSGTLPDECGQTSTKTVSWKMAFNAKDGTQKLPGYGTLDIDGDGDVTADDSIKDSDKPATGLQKNEIVFSDNSVSTFSQQQLKKTKPGEPQNQFCNYIVQIGQDAQGHEFAKQICRQSYTGSWTELK